MSDLTLGFAKMINSRSRLLEDIPQGDVGDKEYLEFFEMGEEEPTIDPNMDQEGTDNEEQPPMAGIAMVAYAAACLANDMKHIHLHARGEQFDNVHALAGGYYDKAGADTDLLAEMALECDQDVQNLGCAKDNLDWELETTTEYQYEEAIQVMSSCICSYLSYLDNLAANLDGDKKAEIETLQRYWRKELEYKLARR